MEDSDSKNEQNPYTRIKYLEYLCPERLFTGASFRMRISLFNGSEMTLSESESIYLSYHWFDSFGKEPIVWNGGWTPLKNGTPSGRRVILYPVILAPDKPGDYILEIDFVHEDITWFGMRKADTLRIPLKIRKNVSKSRCQEPTDGKGLISKIKGRFIENRTLNYFLIVGVQRSGTSVIHVNTSKHPYIECLTGELKVSPLFIQGG